jgi:hypothetical protein
LLHDKELPDMMERCLSFCCVTLGAMLLLTSGKPLRAQAAPAPTTTTTTRGQPESPAFLVCKGTYALCTKAKCEDKGDFFSCECDVKQGLSAGSSKQACSWVPPVEPAPGLWIPSRYYPVESYVVCPISKREEHRTWAFCLDSPCMVDKDPLKAQCICGKSKLEPYVFVTDYYHLSGCESEIISSATVGDIQQITQFLEKTPLKPPHIKVLEPPK